MKIASPKVTITDFFKKASGKQAGPAPLAPLSDKARAKLEKEKMRQRMKLMSKSEKEAEKQRLKEERAREIEARREKLKEERQRQKEEERKQREEERRRRIAEQEALKPREDTDPDVAAGAKPLPSPSPVDSRLPDGNSLFGDVSTSPLYCGDN
jgi:hypothetical protein